MFNHSLKHVDQSFSLNDIKQQFTVSISQLGIKPPQQLIADGKIHRFSTNDHPSDDAGWYVLYPDGFPAGAFGDWRTGIQGNWRAKVGRSLSETERQHLVEREKAIQQTREIDRDTRWKQARDRAEEIWAKAKTAPLDHPYLGEKSVKAYGLKANSSSLMVPLRLGQTLHSLQFINATGDKRFLTGGRKKGCYHLIGEPGEVLCVAEGYATAASIYEATGYAVAVAFDAGNLQPVGMELANRYPGARLLFCADDDRATDSNPGVSKATNAAEATGGLIAVPSFPVGTSGTDFNDLYRACGLDAVRVAINTALAWPAPEPISAALERKEYPIEALPSAIRDAVQEVQAFVQAPPPMIATSALGALSLCVQGLADIRRADTLTGPSSLFTLTIADSGERKSTVDGYFTKAVRDYQDEQRKALYPQIKARKIELKVWKAKRSGLLQKIKSETKQGNPTGEIESHLAKHEDEKPRRILVPQLILSDETPEHLAIVLNGEWPSAAIVSSEAGAVFGSHAMNPESIMRNLSLLNILWDGGELQIGRVSRESVSLKDVRLSVSLQIQPGALGKFLDKNGTLARGNGFLARFLVTWPESTQGSRLMADPPNNWPGLSAFKCRVRELLNEPLPFTPEGGIKPFLLHLNPKASQVWRECHDAIERQLGPGKPLSDIKDVASKVADNVARIATLIHVFQYGPNCAVGPESVTAAFEIASWHINETRRFLGEFSLAPEFSNAALLDDWLCRRCRSEGIRKVAKREVLQYGPNPVRRKRQLDEALELLEELHRVRMVKDGKRQLIQPNPVLLDKA